MTQRTANFKSGALVYAVTAGAAFCFQGLLSPAVAAEPKAQIEGDLAPDLKAAVAHAVGDTERPIENRFEARRRAREAAEDAITVVLNELDRRDARPVA